MSQLISPTFDDFYDRFFRYSYKILFDHARYFYKRFDDHVCRSSALEALDISYKKIVLQNIESGSEQAGIVKVISKWTLRKNALKARWIWDKRHTYAPTKGFVPLQEWQASFEADKFCNSDLDALIGSPIFTETQKMVLGFLIQGYDYKEIAELTSYGYRHIHQVATSLNCCLLGKKETDFVFPKKWGRIGSAKERKINL